MKIRSHILLLLAACLLLPACSTKKNTAGSRFWHSFNARFNTYFNGSTSYDDGMQAKEQGNKDNYTEMLPFFIVENEKSAQLGASNFETTITKCEKAIHLHSIKRRPVVSANKTRTPKMKAYLSRKEFNPFLKNAWLLMGKAQYQKGDFAAAASTFSYITRLYAAEPLVAAEARIWQARSYTALEWYYDAEESLGKAGRDSLPTRLQRDHNATRADLLLCQGKYAEAAPLLAEAARRERKKLPRARLYFLLGQVEREIGHQKAAYDALRKCIKQNPPYELAFNARILQTEVMGNGPESKKMISRLKRMARSSNNKDYLDQVYYAMGNIYLTQGDTAAAIGAYEKGREKATRSGIEKGVLLLRLGGLYWERAAYDKAQKCYADALGLIDKEYKGYEEISRRSKVLDELVPYTSAVQLQDSLLLLSVMSEEERNAAIDRVIAELRRQEEEARKAKADSAAEARLAQNGGGQGSTMTNRLTNTNNRNTNSRGNDATWYFYDPMQVQQGKQDFARHWGRRKNEDDWRRANKTVLADLSNESYDYAAEDSLKALEDSLSLTDSLAVAPEDSLADDPHERAYYLKQIPFTPEAKEAAHEIIRDGLYNAGLIEKDKLEDFPLAARTLVRLCTDYPDCEQREDALYQLFLLYSRTGDRTQADYYRRLLAADYPEGAMTRVITDPDYEYSARFALELEDSLYRATYNAYRERRRDEVETNFTRSTDKYPNGANRPKFIFVHALNRLGYDDPKAVADELRALVKDYPKSDVSEMAGMIVKGLESGRTVGSGVYDIGSLWTRRSSAAREVADSTAQGKEWSDERITPFLCIVAYPTDSIHDNQLLYEVAHFNFTGFMVRNFEMSILREPDITQFRVAGFNSFDEAHTYAQKLYNAASLQPYLRQARLVVISEGNLELLGTVYSYDDYRDFYDRTFAPLQINPDLPLDGQEEPVEQHYEDEYTPEELDNLNKGGGGSNDDDEGEWYSE